MTAIKDIKEAFCSSLCEQIEIFEEKRNYFRVFTPFRFDDGDHLVIVLKKYQEGWCLSDEGHTYMHLSYGMDEEELLTETRQQVISNALSEFQVQDKLGELILPIEDSNYGEGLCNFVQALLKICDVSYLSKDRVKSTFYEDFKNLIARTIPWERYQFDWYDPLHDIEKIYKVDCYVNGMKNPLYIYALSNDDRTRDATISLMEFRQRGSNFQSMGIFQNSKKITSKVFKRFSKICDKKFGSLEENEIEIVDYIRQVIDLPSSSR